MLPLNQQLEDCEREIINMKNQLNAFINELNHLKMLELRYKEENSEIQRRIDSEGS